MEIQLGKLKNIRIENYGFSDHELPILALITNHLENTDDPSKQIEKALSSEFGLANLIDNAKETASKISFSESLSAKQFELFLSLVDGKKIAQKYWTALKPFLQDCWKEL